MYRRVLWAISLASSGVNLYPSAEYKKLKEISSTSRYGLELGLEIRTRGRASSYLLMLNLITYAMLNNCYVIDHLYFTVKMLLCKDTLSLLLPKCIILVYYIGYVLRSTLEYSPYVILSFAGTIVPVHGYFYAPVPSLARVVKGLVFCRYMAMAHPCIRYRELCYIERLPLDFDVDCNV
jgi:hypothetical protein